MDWPAGPSGLPVVGGPWPWGDRIEARPADELTCAQDSHLQEMVVRTSEIDSSFPAKWIRCGTVGWFLRVIPKADRAPPQPLDYCGELCLTYAKSHVVTRH